MVKVVFLGSCRFSPYEILAVPDPIPGAHNTDAGYEIAFKVFKPAIENADVVIVHNPDSIGEHTGLDLAYAESQDKHIVYTHPLKNSTEIFGEGYIAGYNQALVDTGFMTQEEADKTLRGLQGKTIK